MPDTLTPNLNDDLKQLNSLFDETSTVMLSTVGPSGEIHSRPMEIQEIDPHGNIWFFTGFSSEKAMEIRENEMVNLNAMVNKQTKFVSVSGYARLSKDPQKIQSLWTPEVEKWFPNGPKDPNVSLLSVQAKSAEYWNSAGSESTPITGLLRKLGIAEEPAENSHSKINFEA